MPQATAAKQFRTRGRHYALAVFSSIAATALRGALDPVLADAFPFIFSFGAVAITAATGGWRAGTVATIISYLLDDWFLISPRGSLALLTSPAAAIAFSSFCFTSVIIVWLAEMARTARRIILETELMARNELEHKVSDRTRELSALNAELEAFSYTVSHDLRSPMRNIEGFISLALEEPNVSADLRGHLERCVRLSRDAQGLMDDLLHYSRLKNLDVKLGPVSVESAVYIALERLDKAKKAAADIRVGALTSQVIGNETLLVQVLQNLLSNALKFTVPGHEPRIEISESRRDEAVHLEIRDHGIGIAPEYQDKIFKAFERLPGSQKYPGSGVGLAIVQRAVTKMHGRLGVISKPNEGATFWIELPAAH